MNLPNNREWVLLDVVLSVHEAQLSEHGGRVGIRDQGLLASALARPMNADLYAENPIDVPVLAAIYGIAIIRNHPFVDGNKRVGLVVLELFLELNGFRLEADDATCVKNIRALAESTMSDEDFVRWVSANSASQQR